jgi:hypothetical protein
MREARIVLQRRVARDMAVLAPRMLEHLLHGGEGSDRLSPLLGGGARATSRQRKRQEGQQPDAGAHG